MKLINIMKRFTKTPPPEDVDLLVCNITDDPEDRMFERVRFYRKGSVLEHEYRAKGDNDLERFLDHMENEPSAWEPAPETGYYFLIHCPKEDRLLWHISRINPLDSLYVIIDPEEDPGN